jgi:hypothetical protein
MKHTSLCVGNENQISDQLATIANYRNNIRSLIKPHFINSMLQSTVVTLTCSGVPTSADIKNGVTIYNTTGTIAISVGTITTTILYYFLATTPDPTKTLYWSYDGSGDIAIGGIALSARTRVINK